MPSDPKNPLHTFDCAQEGGWDYLGGIDEAGRGALAGPVVAAAVLLRRDFYESDACRELFGAINDSKQLPPPAREAAFERIIDLRENRSVLFATGCGSVGEIAERNILGATSLAMRRALDSVLKGGGLPEPVAFCTDADEFPLVIEHQRADQSVMEGNGTAIRIRLVIDGLPVKRFLYPHTGIVKGDGKSFAIAMASILAKVTRDRMMRELDAKYPVFGLARHKGYGTRRHLDALREHGPCVHHRERFLRKFCLTMDESSRPVP